MTTVVSADLWNDLTCLLTLMASIDILSNSLTVLLAFSIYWHVLTKNFKWARLNASSASGSVNMLKASTLTKTTPLDSILLNATMGTQRF